MSKHLWEFLRSEEGPTAVEYAVLLALIVISCIGAVLTLSNATADSFEQSSTQLSGAFGS